MEKIKFNDIKEGDYIMADLKKEMRLKWEKTYFKAKNIDAINENVKGEVWVDFDKDGNFIEVLREQNSVSEDKCIFYKLSEKEYYEKVGKLLIVDRL